MATTRGTSVRIERPLVSKASAELEPWRRESSAVGAGMSSEDLFGSYQPRIRRYIMGMVHDPGDADDLTQEVFLQAHRKLDSVRDPDALTSWLYRIATHVCYDHFRRTSRRPRMEPLEVGDSAGAASAGDGADDVRLDRVIERGEMSACVRRFLEDLSDEYRQVILLHDLEGLKNTEIAPAPSRQAKSTDRVGGRLPVLP